MQEALIELRNEVLKTLSGTRSGRTYFVPGTRRTYTASAPGQPPAQATSALRQSIKWTIEKIRGKVVGKVGTDLIQGLMTEYGTRNMAARPWLLKSAEKAQGKMKKILSRKWL